MGFFNTLQSFFNGAPKAEVDKVNETLRDVARQSLSRPDSIIVDEVEPSFRVNRADRRKASRSFRQRTRVTGISKRDQRRSARSLHEDANNKGLHFVNHGLLHSLFSRAGVFKPESEVAA